MMFLSVILLYLTSASAGPCKEGEVIGLDGSCVKKFVVPKRKAVCPKLSIDNGEIFHVGTNGRMVEVYCDTDYVRVPDTEVLICQVLGTWSKKVPVCLKPGCKVNLVYNKFELS